MNRITILAIFAVFFIPVILAVLMHSQWFDWRPAETRNHGELIEPPRPLEPFELTDADGRPLRRDDLLDRWQLLHFTPGACTEDCIESLYWLRQVRRAQDRHQPEIALLLITSEPLEPAARNAINELQTDVRILDGEAGRKFAGFLPEPAKTPVSYILDPSANIILRYPPDSDFNGMRRDLGRLLTWTRTDEPIEIPDASDS